jgi:hypothetical protein
MGNSISHWDSFESLTPSRAGEAIHALHCGVMRSHLLLKGEDSEPILLLKIGRRKSPRISIRLKHIQIAFEVPYRVTDVEDAKVVDGFYCRMVCDSSSSALHRYFVELVLATTSQFGSVLTEDQVDSAVDALLEVFRRADGPRRTTVAGLWGELFLIATAESPQEWVKAWRMTQNDAFDFVFSASRVEAKATDKAVREHNFSLHQVRTDRSTDYIASIILTRSSGGESVLGLADRIAGCVDSACQAKLWAAVLGTLGDDAEFSEEQRFDEGSAQNSLIFLPAHFVPAPNVDPADSTLISNVRYRAQIESVCVHHAVPRSVVIT